MTPNSGFHRNDGRGAISSLSQGEEVMAEGRRSSCSQQEGGLVKRTRRLDAFIKALNTLMAVAAAVMIIFMMFAICYAVLARFCWNEPVPWVVEVSSYLMLYITFLGMAWLQGKNGHVRIDLFTSRLGTTTTALLDVFTSLGGVAIGLVLTWKGAAITIDYFHRDVTVIGILNTPQYLLMGIIPLGGALLLIEFILQTLGSFRRLIWNPEPSCGPAPEGQGLE
jgi:C4-dicarboxylate transporter, DctQ subunit